MTTKVEQCFVCWREHVHGRPCPEVANGQRARDVIAQLGRQDLREVPLDEARTLSRCATCRGRLVAEPEADDPAIAIIRCMMCARDVGYVRRAPRKRRR